MTRGMAGTWVCASQLTHTSMLDADALHARPQGTIFEHCALLLPSENTAAWSATSTYNQKCHEQLHEKNGPLLQIKMPDDASTKPFLNIKCMGLVYAAMQCFLEVQSNAQLMTNKLLEMHEQRKRFDRDTAHHGEHCMPIGSVHVKL